jgi:hypothetical protein
VVVIDSHKGIHLPFSYRIKIIIIYQGKLEVDI